MSSDEPRMTQWVRVSNDPDILIREVRPAIHRPLDCPWDSYDVVHHPMKYQYEGACRNYDMMRLECVYCGAALMSNALFDIPFDVRARCDNVMGW